MIQVDFALLERISILSRKLYNEYRRNLHTFKNKTLKCNLIYKTLVNRVLQNKIELFQFPFLEKLKPIFNKL